MSRDHDAAAAPGLYNICYVNAFQAQPDAASWWKTNHPDLLLHDKNGNLVIDRTGTRSCSTTRPPRSARR